MEEQPIRRRRRVIAEPETQTTSQLATPVAANGRRRRASTGGHALKLDAPAREGYKRHWFNDDGNRLAEADELGYDFVTEGGLKTSDPGTRTSRLVGTKANGEPLRAYLMETPDELYAQGLAEKEAHNRQIDDAIIAGRDSTGQMETYGHGSIKSDR
jgi:hypothetical protein